MRSIQTISQILHSFIMERKLVKRGLQACKQLLLNEYVKPNQVRFILTKNDNFYHLNKCIFNNVQKKSQRNLKGRLEKC